MKPGYHLVKCFSCKGKGTTIKYDFMLSETIVKCNRCWGTGKVEVKDLSYRK